jgi:hypothetical protein
VLTGEIEKSKLRGDTKRTYEEVGWSEADKNFGPATPKKNAGTPKKGGENGKKTPSSTAKKRGAKEMETDANDNDDDDDGFSNFNLFGSKKMKKDEDEEESKEIKAEQVETQF